MNLLSRVGIAAVVAMLVGLMAGPVSADKTNCVNETLRGGTYDTVRVEDGNDCILYGAVVEGNVEGDGAGIITIIGTEVKGSIQIKESRSFSVLYSLIAGNVKVEENSSRVDRSLLRNRVRNNTIGGNLQVFNNNIRVDIYDNEIGGNLQCHGNVDPTGWGNVVSGDKEDQCVALTD